LTSPNNKVDKILLNHYKLLFDKTPISIVLLDTTGQIVEVNTTTLDLFGFAREDLIGHKYNEIWILTADIETHIEELFSYLLKGRIYGPEDVQIDNKDRKPVWVSLIASKIELDEKSYIQVISQDISQRKLLEQRVEESERRYRGLYESSPIALTVTDSNGVILDVNSATEKIFGFKRGEVIGKKYFDLGIFSPEIVERFIEDYEESLKGKKITPMEIQIKKKMVPLHGLAFKIQ